MKTDQALIELSRASSKVAALTRAIGEAMKCSYEAQTANGGTYTDWIELAYKVERVEDEWGRPHWRHANHDNDVDGYLVDHCPHAMVAHRLIKERKEARKVLGIARRRVSVIANRLAREAMGAA